MDILIKNMEMPKSCGNCQFNQFHEANPWTTWETCTILDKDTDANGNGRLADCPLVALPEHGRLIDADKLIHAFDNRTDLPTGYDIYTAIAEAETILEATK